MSLKLLSIPNDPDNAYDRTKTRYLKLQKPGKYMVNGKRELYIPNTPYQTFSKTGRPTIHQPCPEWAPDEKTFRDSVFPTSTAFSKIIYDPFNKVMRYGFKNGKKTYAREMTRDLWNMFITSSSLGQFYNSTLKIHGRLAIRKGRLMKWDASTKKPKLVKA